MAAVMNIERKPLDSGIRSHYNADVDSLRESEYPMLKGEAPETERELY